MPYFSLPGFDKWCRVKSGLSNAKIAEAVSSGGASYPEELIKVWRQGGGIPDPDRTLLPLRIALKGPWPPATAEEAWLELVEVIQKGMAGPPVEAPVIPEPGPVEMVEKTARGSRKPRSTAAAPVGDPRADALKKELAESTKQLQAAISGCEQLWAGWFARTNERFKKYVPRRDFKHRKAFLLQSVEQAAGWLEKARARHQELTESLERSTLALSDFETLETHCADGMQVRRDDFVGLHKQLKTLAPALSAARQAAEKARSKTLGGLEELIARAEGFQSEWQAKADEMNAEPHVDLHWLTPGSKLGERLREVWQKYKVEKKSGTDWPPEFDPFVRACVCRDKLADNYQSPPRDLREKPVEIDLACSIDLGIVDLETRRQAARALAEGN